MGCGSSQAVSVINVVEENKNEKIKENISLNSINKIDENNSQINESKVDETNKGLELKLLVNNNKPNNFGKERKVDFKDYQNNGADSKLSGNSDDDDGEEDPDDCDYLYAEYENVITENSDKTLIEKVEQDFVSKNNLDLFIAGKSCPPLLSNKEKELVDSKEEKNTQEMLKKNGLVQLPVEVKQNYARFEIVEEKLLNRKNNVASLASVPPPSRLLIKREPTKLTADYIEEKLEKANQRKMEKLKIKILNSSISLEKKTDDPEQQQRYNSSDVLERQKRLVEIRDKLKAKDIDKDNSLSTPRTKELVNELQHFRPRTSTNFRPDY